MGDERERGALGPAPEACDPSRELTEESVEEFGELLRFTAAGYAGGLALGALLDAAGLAGSGLGQAAVRTLSGEGESLLEGFFAIRKRWTGARVSFAQVYGWGKLAGLAAPWVVDGVSRGSGVDVHGIPGFYIPFFYAMSDQIGANLAGLFFLRKETGGMRSALRAYLTHPVMLAGLAILLGVPLGLALARVAGFTPRTQVLTALETIVANLCWVPPAVGWLSERRRRGDASD